MLVATTKRLRNNKRGVSNVIVVMLSLVLIVIIVSNVVLWSYQMNQADWERLQEKISLVKVERTTNTHWFPTQQEYIVGVGSNLFGTYSDTQLQDGNYESFSEEPQETSNYPSQYLLGGSTRYVSGSAPDLTANDASYMIFGTYPSEFAPQSLYAHTETITIAGIAYSQLKLESSDMPGQTLSADASTLGRKLWARDVYSLSGMTSISASTWRIYYRGYKTGSDVQVVVHCDVDILIRQSNGTVRTTIATNAANSPDLARDVWTTVSATYSWNDHAIVEDTDFLEVDFYAHVTAAQAGRNAYLRIDDSSLLIGDQTRITSAMMPISQTVDVELQGSSDSLPWQSLTWMIDSSFSVSNVNATIQLYNYSAGQYPTSGDGFIHYTSSLIPDIDEISNQTVGSNPTVFMGPSGEWKIRVTGIKDGNVKFDIRIDIAVMESTSNGSQRLKTIGDFALDLTTYPVAYLLSIEIQVRYRANDSLENWFLKAYNWSEGEFGTVGFNVTFGDTPTSEFKYYGVEITSGWQSYLQNNTVKIKFCDGLADGNQTHIDVDFLAVRLVVNKAKFSFANEGSMVPRVVAIWITNSSIHRRYDADFFIDSGSTADYVKEGMDLPSDSFTVRAITERGNIAVFNKS